MDHSSAVVVEAPRRPALSPSRAGDFKQCPLLYRFRAIDRLPEVPTRAQVRGTLVHAVLERLYDLPAAQREPAAARALVAPEWARLCEEGPELFGALFTGPDDPELPGWLASAGELLDAYFRLEDPRRLEPEARELLVETELASGLLLRGYIDRVDVAPGGEIRLVDYKGLAVDTPLPTPTGWTTMGEIQVGDALLGSDGVPCQVVAKSEVHHRPCYEVRFTDGTRLVADNVHLWPVHLPSRSDSRYSERVVNTEDLHHLMLNRPTTARGRRRPFIRAAAPLILAEAALPIEPWILGAWLGDGASRGGQLTVGHDDRDDMLRLLKEHWFGRISIEPASMAAGALTVGLARPRPDLCPYGHDDFSDRRRGKSHHRRCRQERLHTADQRWNACLADLLRRADLIGRKHIPPAYLRASPEQRLALLRGLMDTDGSWNGTRRRAVFVTTTPALAHGVRELVHSLGGSTMLFEKPYVAKRGPRTVHVVEFRPHGFNPFSLPRKAVHVDAWLAGPGSARGGEVPGELRRTIAAVTPVASVPTQCVKVDAPDSLYLCGQTFVPTHNTGASPRQVAEARALFQMKFYALALLHLRGVVPRQLRLLYLADEESLTYAPDEAELRRFERTLEAIWLAIRAAGATGDFRPNRSRMCEWCSYQAQCPAWDGTPPAYPGWPGDEPAATESVLDRSD